MVLTLGEKDAQKCVNGVDVHYFRPANIYFPFKSTRREVLKKFIWKVLDFYNFAMARKVEQALHAKRPDIVHTHNLSGFSVSAWRAAKSKGFPLVHTLRDYYLLCARSTMFKANRNCQGQCIACHTYSSIKARESKGVDHVVGVSRFILDKHLSSGYFQNASASVIYNGISAPAPPPHPPRTRANTFGYLGRLEPAKGIEGVLKVFRELGSPYRLVVGGKGNDDYVARLKKNYKADNIEFLGYIDPQAFYASIDFLIVPSLWHEPLSRTIIEAYAQGIPVLASARGGSSEIVRHGVTGYLFEPEDLRSLIHIVRSAAATKELSALKDNCIIEARRFASDAIASQYLSIYEELA